MGDQARVKRNNPQNGSSIPPSGAVDRADRLLVISSYYTIHIFIVESVSWIKYKIYLPGMYTKNQTRKIHEKSANLRSDP